MIKVGQTVESVYDRYKFRASVVDVNRDAHEPDLDYITLSRHLPKYDPLERRYYTDYQFYANELIVVDSFCFEQDRTDSLLTYYDEGKNILFRVFELAPQWVVRGEKFCCDLEDAKGQRWSYYSNTVWGAFRKAYGAR